MTARTHDLAAITAFGLVATVQSVRTVTVATAILAVLFNQIGGIFPDIDQPTAYPFSVLHFVLTKCAAEKQPYSFSSLVSA